MLIEDFIIKMYCVVDEKVKLLQKQFRWRRGGFAPKLSDSEAITLAMVGEFLGMDCDKHIWTYFKNHFQSWFPQLGDRSTFTRQLANVWWLEQKIWEILLEDLKAHQENLYMVDGFPIPVCGFRRVPIASCFKESAGYGYCAAKSLMYYGFHGNIVVNESGVIVGFSLTRADASEREAVWEITNKCQGLLCGDKGYTGQFLKEGLWKGKNLLLLTPPHARQRKQQDPQFTSLILKFRKRVETVIGQLAERFHIEKVRARDLWHITSRLTRKILSHTLALFINDLEGNKPLQLEKLLNL